MAPLPLRLAHPPLVEAVVEIRFAGTDQYVGELLPGSLRAALTEDRFSRHDALPIAQVPREIRTSDPGLRYQPQYRLRGIGESLLLGDHVVAYSKVPPYLGWSTMQDAVHSVLEKVRSSGLVQKIERFSFRVLNVIPPGNRHPLELINGKLVLGDLALLARGLTIRVESEDQGFTNVLELASGATARLEGEVERSGVLLSVDSIRRTDDVEFWKDSKMLIDRAHAAAKRIFFSVLSPSVLNELGPE